MEKEKDTPLQDTDSPGLDLPDPDSLRNTGEKLLDIAKVVVDFFKKAGSVLKEITFTSPVSYDDIFKYFTDYNKDPKIVKGVLLKQKEDNHILLYQVFLDKDNNIVCNADQSPMGRKLKVRQMDDELNELFGSKDMVIVE